MIGENRAAEGETRPQLLLVEDDDAVRRSIQLLLQARGFDVRAYAAGPALLADPRVTQARCLVSDYFIQGSDGLEILERLRARGWNGPAVLITAFGSPDLERRARAQGYSAVLRKPFREHVLTDTVARLVSQSRSAATQRNNDDRPAPDTL